MTLKRKGELLILNYKMLFKESIIVKLEKKEGELDISFRLSFFSKELSKTENNYEQQRFNDMFFGCDEKKIQHKEKDNLKLPILSKGIKKPKNNWIKKVYKKVVNITHPDKTSKIGIASLVDKLTEQYMLTIKSFKQNDFPTILMIASDLGIGLEEEKVKFYMADAVKNLVQENIKIKSSIGYMWFHADQFQRETALKDHLNKLGFAFQSTAEIRKAVIRKRPKRKVGERPIKARRMKLK